MPAVSTEKTTNKKKENMSKMRDLLSKARAGEPSIFTQGKNSKRLEFSNLSLGVYDKHNAPAYDIFFNRNTK